MEKLYRNRVVKSLFGIPAYLSVAAFCLVGLMKTSSEMSDQNVWFVYSVLALLACAVLSFVFNIRKTKIEIVDTAAAAMFLWYLISFFTNESIAVTKLLEVCFYAPVYISLRILFSSHRSMAKWMFVILCVCGIFEAVLGLRQAFGVEPSNHSLFSVTGTFFNPGPYGGYIAVILALATGYVASRYEDFRLRPKPDFQKIVLILIGAVAVCALISIVIILPSTLSRAAFVATGVAAVAIVLSNKKVYEPIVDWCRSNKKMASLIGIVAVVVISGAAWGIYALKKDSADGRLFMWKMDTKVMLENPFTGAGPGYFRGAMGDVQADYFGAGNGSETELKVAGCPEYGFNEFLQIGAETGVTGLLLFVFLIVSALWRLFRVGSFYALGLLALVVFACFSYPFSILPMKMMFVSFLAAAGSYSSGHRQAGIVDRIITTTVLGGCVCIAIFSTKPYLARVEATREWQESQRWYSMELYSYVLDDYPELFPVMKENPTFLFEYGRSLNMEGRYAESLDVLIPATKQSNDPMFYNVIGNNYKALGQYDKAAEAYLRAHDVMPGRMYPLYLLAKNYSEAGDREQSAHYARRVVEMAPKIPSPATEDMQREMQELLKNIEADILQK